MKNKRIGYKRVTQISLFAITFIILTLLVILIYNEISNEKKTKSYFVSIAKNQAMLKDISSAQLNIAKSQNYLLDYMANNSAETIRKYFETMKHSQTIFDTLYLKNNHKNFSTNQTPNDSIESQLTLFKDSLNKVSEKVLNNLLNKKNFEQGQYRKMDFDEMGIKTTIKTTRHTDSIKKKGLFSRLGNALNNKTEVQKEEETHIIIVEYNNDQIIGSLEEQFKALLDKVNKHYQTEINNINNSYTLALQQKQNLLKINEEIQNTSQKLIADYEKSIQEQDNILNQKYDLQYMQNRERRFYILLILSLMLIILIIGLASITQKNYKYELLLADNLETIKNNLRTKNNIISIISHDVRAPLKIISLYIKQLLAMENSEEKKEMYSAINYTTDSAYLLSNRILEYLKNEKLGTINKPIELNLYSEINSTVNGFLSLAKTKQNSITNNNFVPKDRLINIDKQQLQRLYFNLIGNAIKYTKEGNIEVTTKYSDLDNDSFRLEIVVADTGTGMTENQLSSIFKPFDSKNNNLSSTSSIGFGLHLCKEIVEHLGGGINIISSPNKGTTVKLHLRGTKKQDL